jgi:hypothetical protein
MNWKILPLPMEPDLQELISDAAKETGLSKSRLMRQGLRLGVPAVVAQFKENQTRQRPASLDYLDDFPISPVSARDSKRWLKEKLRARNATHR